MTLAAGRLRHRVEIQAQETIVNTSGERTTYWAHVGYAWASVEPVSAKEFAASQQIQSKVNTRVMIRYRPGIVASMRILHKGAIFNIEGVLSDKESGIEYLTLPCSSGVNDG